MASYLVMKNNLRRMIVKKSTYLVMILVPVLLTFIGSISVRIGEKQIRIGVVGGQSFLEEVQNNFKEKGIISIQIADARTINTEQIMGKYHFVLKEQTKQKESEKVVNKIKAALAEENVSGTDDLSAAQRMVSMLLTVYMTIATIYGMKYIQDKKDGVLERFMTSGKNRYGYIMGYFGSNIIVTGLQLFVILLFWKICDKNFSVPLASILQVFIFILVISNLYGILLTQISKSELMAGILGSSLAVLLSIMGGSFVAVNHMPAVLQKISILSPMRWLMLLVT